MDSKDQLMVQFFGISLFEDKNGNFFYPRTLIGPTTIPKLGTAEEIAAAVELGSTVSSVV
jgi:hypothetical protein